jgi:hypothetical protein
MATLESIRAKEGFEWKGVYSFRTKEDAGHEPPWLCYLKGENPSFPVEMLQAAMAQVFRRSEQIRQVKFGRFLFFSFLLCLSRACLGKFIIS